MKKRFFKPYKKDNYYNEGLLNGKKVLILGASFYCPYNESSNDFNCPKWNECTSMEIKDSSKFNEFCYYFKHKGYTENKLEDTPEDEITNYLEGCDYPSYDNFTQFMIEYVSKITGEQKMKNEDWKMYIWERLAFTNYVQYFLPTQWTPTQTKRDIRNFEAFLETLDELQPDVIIIWGTKITDHFKKKYIQAFTDKLEKRNNPYFWNLSYHGKRYILINPYHPCNYHNQWQNNLEEFKQALDLVFKNNLDI